MCFVGESVKVEILADNSQGRENISSFSIKLIQYTFVSANNGANRTYQREISSEKLKWSNYIQMLRILRLGKMFLVLNYVKSYL